MAADEWDAKARKLLQITLSPSSETTFWNTLWDNDQAALAKAIAVFAEEINTAAERRGIERAALVAEDYGNTILIARLFALRIAERIRAVAPPMADAGPTEPAAATARTSEQPERVGT